MESNSPSLHQTQGGSENGPGGTNVVFNGATFRYWGPGREAIAVDGSSDNVIRHNWITGSSAGGVFLYTNCGENVHTGPANWIPHPYGAERNVIADNLIVGGATGVWVASRMGDNVYPMDCSDVPYVSGPLKAITLDRAAHNVVASNTISGVQFGVRVEDDDTRVVGNTFLGSDPSDTAVVVGTPYRTAVLARPVRNTPVTANRSQIASNRSPFRWVDGVTGLQQSANTAGGQPSPFCAAPNVPRGPFVMVYAVAPQDPAQPPVPPPPYVAPTLGVLPPCA